MYTVEDLIELLNSGKIDENILRWLLDGKHISMNEYIKALKRFTPPIRYNYTDVNGTVTTTGTFITSAENGLIGAQG